MEDKEVRPATNGQTTASCKWPTAEHPIKEIEALAFRLSGKQVPARLLKALDPAWTPLLKAVHDWHEVEGPEWINVAAHLLFFMAMNAEAHYWRRVLGTRERIARLKDLMTNRRERRRLRLLRSDIEWRLERAETRLVYLLETDYWPRTCSPRTIRQALVRRHWADELDRYYAMWAWVNTHLAYWSPEEVYLNYGELLRAYEVYKALGASPRAMGAPLPPQKMVLTDDLLDAEVADLVGLASASKGMQLKLLADLAEGNLTQFVSNSAPLRPVNIVGEHWQGPQLDAQGEALDTPGRALGFLIWLNKARPGSRYQGTPIKELAAWVLHEGPDILDQNGPQLDTSSPLMVANKRSSLRKCIALFRALEIT